jgi:hypothetical protein
MALDPATIGLIVTVSTLVVERLYDWFNTIRKSKCGCCSCVRKPDTRDEKPEIDH